MDHTDAILSELKTTREFLLVEIKKLGERFDKREDLCREHHSDIQLVKAAVLRNEEFDNRINSLEKFQIKLISIYATVTFVAGILYALFGDILKGMVK